jgi:hypothetical protein
MDLMPPDITDDQIVKLLKKQKFTASEIGMLRAIAKNKWLLLADFMGLLPPRVEAWHAFIPMGCEGLAHHIGWSIDQFISPARVKHIAEHYASQVLAAWEDLQAKKASLGRLISGSELERENECDLKAALDTELVQEFGQLGWLTRLRLVYEAEVQWRRLALELLDKAKSKATAGAWPIHHIALESADDVQGMLNTVDIAKPVDKLIQSAYKKFGLPAGVGEYLRGHSSGVPTARIVAAAFGRSN